MLIAACEAKGVRGRVLPSTDYSQRHITVWWTVSEAKQNSSTGLTVVTK